MNQAELWDTLRTILDPEVGLNIVDLGLVRSVAVEGDVVRVQMTLTSPGCPMGASLVDGVRAALRTHGAQFEPEVELVWDPPWSPDDILPAARALLARG